MRLQNKNILITGASRGIGKVTAIILGSQGANIAINYLHNEEKALKVQEEVEKYGSRAILIKGDVADPSDVKDIFCKMKVLWGQRLDVLINNAGITRDSFLEHITDEQWETVIHTNLNSAFYCTREAFRIMKEQKYGKIINVSSCTAIMGNIGQANYAASKAGIIGLTKTAALEGAKYGIRVNAVCPGLHRTEIVDSIPEKVLNGIIKKIPLGYIGSAEDIAQMISFLAGPESDYITGQTLMVNGGLTM
jgi:3-oxoacyl-[acyl-carrier protein] reductase